MPRLVERGQILTSFDFLLLLYKNGVHSRGAQCIDMEILISKNGNIDIDIDIDKRTFE